MNNLKNIIQIFGDDITSIVIMFLPLNDYNYLIGKWKNLHDILPLTLEYKLGRCLDEEGHPDTKDSYIEISFNEDSNITISCYDAICESCNFHSPSKTPMNYEVSFDDDKHNHIYNKNTYDLIFTMGEFEQLLNHKLAVNIITASDVLHIGECILNYDIKN